jgi:hypothetical protein
MWVQSSELNKQAMTTSGVDLDENGRGLPSAKRMPLATVSNLHVGCWPVRAVINA